MYRSRGAMSRPVALSSRFPAAGAAAWLRVWSNGDLFISTSPFSAPPVYFALLFNQPFAGLASLPASPVRHRASGREWRQVSGKQH
jgi:hypothetical protein